MSDNIVPLALLFAILWLFGSAECYRDYFLLREHVCVIYRLAFALAGACGLNGLIWGWA